MWQSLLLLFVILIIVWSKLGSTTRSTHQIEQRMCSIFHQILRCPVSNHPSCARFRRSVETDNVCGLKSGDLINRLCQDQPGCNLSRHGLRQKLADLLLRSSWSSHETFGEVHIGEYGKNMKTYLKVIVKLFS